MPQSGGIALGFRGNLRPPRIIADDGVILPSDADGSLRFTSGSAATCTVPLLPVGFTCLIIQAGAGTVTVSAGSGMIIDNRPGQLDTAGQNAICGLVVDAVGHAILSGDTA